MAPIRTKNRVSSPITKQNSPTRTPDRGAIKKPIMITQRQKQSLIDNLQLEITERARKLRAQYAIQSQGLRGRIELRVNRIPTALRKANMGELFAKYAEGATQDKPAVLTAGAASKQGVRKAVARKLGTDKVALPASPVRARGLKRTSDTVTQDKENAPDPFHDTPNPKKRTKTTVTASRQATNPSTVLSPKSSNSRTLPQSPVRPAFGSPQKSHLSRPASSLKPTSPTKAISPAKHVAMIATGNLADYVGGKLKNAKAMAAPARKVTRTADDPKPVTMKAKRGAVNVPAVLEPRTVSSSSNASTMSGASTGTTVVRKIGRALTAANSTVTAAKKGVAKSVAKKALVRKVEVPNNMEKRTLRKRA